MYSNSNTPKFESKLTFKKLNMGFEAMGDRHLVHNPPTLLIRHFQFVSLKAKE